MSEEISKCDDVEFLRETVEKLWAIIDDIDIISDIAKSDDVFYRKRVEKYQLKRWKLGITCDGYKLYRAPQPLIPSDDRHLVRFRETRECPKS